MNEQDRDSAGRPAAGGQPVESMGSAPVPQQSFGSAADGDEQFGEAPNPNGTFGDAPSAPPNPAPTPPSTGGMNVRWLVGGGIALLVVIAAIFGFVVR